jgi:hypothetical protein
MSEEAGVSSLVAPLVERGSGDETAAGDEVTGAEATSDWTPLAVRRCDINHQPPAADAVIANAATAITEPRDVIGAAEGSD